MTAPRFVPRLWLNQESFVTDADAALLEAVVEAAAEMRREVRCNRTERLAGHCDVDFPSLRPCSGCEVACAYDAALWAVGK